MGRLSRASIIISAGDLVINDESDFPRDRVIQALKDYLSKRDLKADWRSVMDAPFTIGRNPDTGGPLQLVVYDGQGGWHTNITAATGGGKTTLYNNVLEQATARSDMLVWPIDLRKGTIPFFWHPALDYWAGLTPDGEPEYAMAAVDAGRILKHFAAASAQ